MSAHATTSIAFGLAPWRTLLPSGPPCRCTAAAPRRAARPHRRFATARRSGHGARDRRRGDGRRPFRVGELIRREMSVIIDGALARGAAEEGETAVISGCMVSVVDVKCSDDLRNAQVSVSVFGGDEQRVAALALLRRVRRDLRFELAQALQLRHVPELSFVESEMAAAVDTVNILNKLAREREAKGRVNEEVSLPSDDELDLDASADDGLILDDELDDVELEDDADDDALIIDVDEDGMDFENMSDEAVRRQLFNTSVNDDLQR